MEGNFMRVAIIAPLSFAALCLGAVTPVFATEPPDALKCVQIKDDTARLACYDRTVPAIGAFFPHEAKVFPATPVAPPAPQPSAEQRFGAERLAKEDKPKEAEEAETISATIQDARERMPGRWIITLDNGQVWQQVVTQSVNSLRPGRKVTIEKALLGSYTLRVDGTSTPIKVSRAK
jgi:hypothetical protein